MICLYFVGSFFPLIALIALPMTRGSVNSRITWNYPSLVPRIVESTCKHDLLSSPYCLSTSSLTATKRVDLGGLVLEVSDARTAQVFHIVDQLSLWDVYTHEEDSVPGSA